MEEWIKSTALTVKVPADRLTTSPAGQASSAAWMAAVASCAPWPYDAASMLAQIVVRMGMPPDTPGFHWVVRSAGRICAAALAAPHSDAVRHTKSVRAEVIG